MKNKILLYQYVSFKKNKSIFVYTKMHLEILKQNLVKNMNYI